MDNTNPVHNPMHNQIQIELPEDVSQGIYSNLAIIAHSASEFVIDFVNMAPGCPKAKVRSRVILTPDNAKRLMYALQDNISKYDEMIKKSGSFDRSFGDIIPPMAGIAGQA